MIISVFHGQTPYFHYLQQVCSASVDWAAAVYSKCILWPLIAKLMYRYAFSCFQFWDLADDGNMFKSFKVGDFTDQRGVNHKLNCLSWSPDAKRVAVVGTFKTVSYSSSLDHFQFLHDFNSRYLPCPVFDGDPQVQSIRHEIFSNMANS